MNHQSQIHILLSDKNTEISGYFYSTLEKFEKADKYFEMALKINADDTVACVNRARNYLKTSEITKIHPLIRRLKEVRQLLDFVLLGVVKII